jgi:predicted transcriptional regulator
MMTMHEDINIFIDCMTRLHCQHLKADIDQFVKSVAEDVVDKLALKQKMVDKWSLKPSLAEKMVDILEFVANKDQFTTEEIVSHFGFNQTTAKRYLRQLTEFGYLESHGGNKNRTYSKSTK